MNRITIIFLLVLVFLDFTSIGMIIPMLPNLIQNLHDSGLGSASMVGGGLVVLFAFFQFLFAPILCALSDQYGRRAILLWGLAGFTIDYAVMALVPEPLLVGCCPHCFWCARCNISGSECHGGRYFQ